MYIDKNLIYRNLSYSSKRELLEELCGNLENAGIVSSAAEFFQAIWQREENFSTGIGRNVAIPHGKSEGIKETKLILALLPDGIEYDSLDGLPVKIVFMFAVPRGRDKEYMALLAKVTKFVRDESNRNKLLDAIDEEEILDQIREVINE